MTEFFNKILDTIRFDVFIDAVETLYVNYPLEAGGVLLFILLLFFCMRMIGKRKARTAQPAENRKTEKDLLEKVDASVSKEQETAVDEDHHIPAALKSTGLVGRLKNGLRKTRRSLADRIENILSEGNAADRETLEELEEVLITSDIGVDTTMALIEKIEKNAHAFKGPDDLRAFLKEEMVGFLTPPRKIDMSIQPYVIMVVGVNGVGKTTTIGKLAYRFQSEGRKVLIGAADTFRAAAVEQLEIWAERSGADIVRHRDNADPAAVAFDAVEAGLSRGSDIVIIDTAGRLQTKVNLMEQLKKIKRSIAKKIPGAPHEVLLVLDATTGQNAISQAKIFHEGIGVNSLVLTKLDGTAKGGIVITICRTLQLPLQYIGVGEAMDDLQPFDPEKFIDAIL